MNQKRIKEVKMDKWIWGFLAALAVWQVADALIAQRKRSSQKK